MTNQISNIQGWLEYAQDAGVQLSTLGPEATCILICWISGVLLKMGKAHKIQWLIPTTLTLAVGPVVFIALYLTGFNSGENITGQVENVWVAKGVVGMELGFATWLINKVFLNKLTDKYLFDHKGDTKLFSKPIPPKPE